MNIPPGSGHPPRRWSRPRVTRGKLAVAALCALFGFALAVQVRTSDSDAGRRAARPEELTRILDDLGTRSDRLRTEVDALRVTRDRLADGTDRSRIALLETERRARVLGVLAGTLPATGAGVVITITDPERRVRAGVILSVVQELRDAGAEAMQLEGGGGPAVRIVAGTAFRDDPAGGVLAGVLPGASRLLPPYRLTAIGDPAAIGPALRIPGGAVDTVAAVPGAAASLATPATATVAALQRLAPPRYARPAATSSPGG